MTAYFMAQRIKPGRYEDTQKIALLHEMEIYSMKCKQTTDHANVEKLMELVHRFERLYFGEQAAAADK